jgi:hypothetical protein
LAVTDRVRVLLADCADEPLLLIVTPKEKLPVAVGVPEMIPLAAARDSPEGSWPELTLHLSDDTPPVAVRLAL